MPPTLANGKICYIEMPAIDVRRSAEFYEKVFGWGIRQRGDGSTAFDDATGEVSGTWITFAPYVQSERRETYLGVWKRLRDAALIYPCTCSRRDILQSASAPHHENEEPVYPGTCRPESGTISDFDSPAGQNWRFHAPDAEALQFVDRRLGTQFAIAGVDFGDFIIWRKDDVPAYQLAVVADDAAMQISEVVRGADLLLSTFRQLLIYRALGWRAPRFYHTELIRDSSGQRLAKRHDSLSLRELRKAGVDPNALRRRYL